MPFDMDFEVVSEFEFMMGDFVVPFREVVDGGEGPYIPGSALDLKNVTSRCNPNFGVSTFNTSAELVDLDPVTDNQVSTCCLRLASAIAVV
jgi:hypothetical protein